MYQNTRDYVCDHCSRTFTRKYKLQTHIENCLVNYSRKCEICGQRFGSPAGLLQHLSRGHNNNGQPFPECELCGRIFPRKQNIVNHMIAVHRQGLGYEIRCQLCEKTYTTEQNLKRHLKRLHNPDVEYPTCNDCNKVFREKHSLIAHIQSVHSVTEKDAIKCHLCDKVCTTRNLKRHIEMFHGEKREFRCDICPKVYTYNESLRRHYRTSHSTKNQEHLTCNFCTKLIIGRKNFESHMKFYHPVTSSLEFHNRISHPQAQIANSNITSTNIDEESGSFKCDHCDRIYYSDCALKRHIKFKHTTHEEVECELCGKICSNKYYLVSHIKIVHNNDSWSRCEYCNKQFKSKRNKRLHIENTHLGMQKRYKCIECEAVLKEKRGLRSHLRTQHPNSTFFPQCHICRKRFESAKSCKIHLKRIHSFNKNTYTCHLCSVSFSSNEELTIHLQTKHLAEDEIYKCEECNLVFKGHEKFDAHNEVCHVNLVPNIKQKVLPCCILCMKDFSTRNSLKRHIKRFHEEFDVDELATFGSRRRTFTVDCEDCIRNFKDDFYFNLYNKLKHLRDSVVFKCEDCSASYTALEFAIQRYKVTNADAVKSKMILSELCTTEMNEDENDFSSFGALHDMLPESKTADIKLEPITEINLLNARAKSHEPALDAKSPILRKYLEKK